MISESTIRKIFEETFNQSPTCITHIPDKGITNDVFIVEMPDQKLILRISPEPNTSQFEKEKWEMEQANKLGVLTPEVIKVGIYKSIVYMIENYIEGAHGTENHIDKKFIWKELGKYAKIVQSIPVEGFGDYMCSPGVFEGNWNEYLDYNIQSLNGSDKLLSIRVLTIEQSEKIKILFESLKKENFQFGLCHGDLSLQNVILNNEGQVLLLDWGSSESQIIPHFDIVEVLQTSFKFDFQNEHFKAFISGLGITEDEFSKIKPRVDALVLLRAIDHLRWGIDKKPERVEHFVKVLGEVLNYLKIS